MHETAPLAVDEPLALAIVNARVWTGDSRRPWADALLIRGDRIDTVGTSAELRKRTSAEVRLIDAKGMMVLPGTADGVIAPGQPGNVVLVERALTSVTPTTLRDAEIVLAVADGRITFDRDALAR